MDKKKQQKQKERERRVAKQKLAEAERRRALAKSEQDSSDGKSAVRAKRVFAPEAAPKVDLKSGAGSKPQVSYRRTGG